MKNLASMAVPLQGTLGRAYPEPDDDTRSPFQRDRDRIIHTQAFRRLQGKTQVFVSGEGDHYRSRLTHTMEVAQISRDIARTLQLNEDLTECIALAHDLGHPPFGHAGEDALDQWMRTHGSQFEHNEQSLRIVTVLEEHSKEFPGLNLNREVLEGIQKHKTPFDQTIKTMKKSKRNSSSLSSYSSYSSYSSLEARVVDLADEIAYTAHDSDDGLLAGIFSLKEITDVSLAKRAHKRTEKRGTSLRGSIIHMLVHDLYEHASPTSIAFSPATQEELDALRHFLWDHLYRSADVVKMNEEGKQIVTGLAEAFFKNPPEKILHLQSRTKSALAEAVKDYVAGMTDNFARSSKVIA